MDDQQMLELLREPSLAQVANVGEGRPGREQVTRKLDEHVVDVGTDQAAVEQVIGRRRGDRDADHHAAQRASEPAVHAHEASRSVPLRALPSLLAAGDVGEPVIASATPQPVAQTISEGLRAKLRRYRVERDHAAEVPRHGARGAHG
ncbi:hypothetical protein OM076_13645 [Solirubrobacter ginsenosidimutans]|uniref:Uncharacterized protein n=1 Tax=Solirubrobacter ginsenosidimutans TaxID=490573 RepID=A0A9X3MQX8_9ACTN|nr:hypothetical protein [Solirubrobacter ginsenosidimutans]MDA0161316.1 hypothetical protein [Solirubrobacter ginsenosidimutans]